jgi:hypothetical protein
MRVGRRALWGFGLGSLAMACIIWHPAFYDLYATGPADWQMIHHNWEAAWVAMTRHGEWPLWDPYHCGGVPILGNPESQALSPLFFLSLLFEPTVGVKIFVVIHAFAGLLGMAILARKHYDVGNAGAAVAAVAWAGSGFFAWHVSEGHGTFIPFFLAPWLILSFRASIADIRYTVAVAALMTVVIFEGGTYPFPYFALLIAFDGLVCLVRTRERGRVVGVGILAAVVTALLAGIRLLPIRATLAELPRDVESFDAITFAELLDMYVAPTHAARFGHEYRWHEYGTYVGWGVLICAAIGLVPALRKKKVHLVVGLLFFGSLLMGNFHPYAPWTLMHELPVYDSLRVPTRFTVFASFYLALLAGMGLDAVKTALGRRYRPSWMPRVAPKLIALVALGLVFDIVWTNYPATNRFDWAPVLEEDPVPSYFLVRGQNYHFQYASYPRRGVGTPACYPWGMRWHVARGLQVGVRPQVRVVEGRGTVDAFRRTNNRVEVEVTMTEPGRILVNQNYYPGWTASVGTAVDLDGKLAVDLPEGSHALVLRYRPPMLWEGAAATVAGLLACAGIFAWRRRRRRASPT